MGQAGLIVCVCEGTWSVELHQCHPAAPLVGFGETTALTEPVPAPAALVELGDHGFGSA